MILTLCRRALTVIVLFLCVLSFSIAHAENPFTDIDQSSVHYDALSFLKDKGVIEGYPDGSFKSDKIVNRAEALKMLLVGLNADLIPDGASTFPDVKQGEWFTPFILAAFKHGFVEGYPDGMFRPGNNVNRVEAMKMLLEIAKVQLDSTYHNRPPLDVEKSVWFEKYTTYIYDRNLLDINSVSELEPGSDMTRGDIAEMLYRLLYMQEMGLQTFTNFQEGRISFYADKFEGRNTAAGEVYAHDVFTAAHKTYDFGTLVQAVDPDSQKAVIVRVNDRGPFVEEGVLDLSRDSFEKIVPTSRGVFQGRVYKLGNDIRPFMKKYIPRDAFPGITLNNSLPNMYNKGELYHVKGQIPNAGEVVVSLRSPAGVTKKTSVVVQNGQFEFPMYVEELGNYKLSIAAPGVASEFVDFFVYDRFFGRAVKTISPKKALLEINEMGDELLITWPEQSEFNLYLLEMAGGSNTLSLFINNGEKVVITKEMLDIFSEGEIQIVLKGNISSTGYSQDAYANWVTLDQTSRFLAGKFDVILRDELVDITSNSSKEFNLGETLKITGFAKVAIKNYMYVVLPGDSISKEKIVGTSNADVLQKGTSFTFTYTPKKSGRYVFEVVADDGRPSLVDAYQSKDVLEVLPIAGDVAPLEVTSDTTELVELRQKILDLTNKDRGQSNVKPLLMYPVLNDIAQFKAEDMAKNKYFSHYDADGVGINDIKYDFGFNGRIIENIVYNTVSIDDAYVTLRNSPLHLNNILDPKAEIIGIGIYRDGDTIFVTQEFSSIPLNDYDVDTLKSDIIQEISNNSVVLTEDGALDDVALQWSMILADNLATGYEINGLKFYDFLDYADKGKDHEVAVIVATGITDMKAKVQQFLEERTVSSRVGLGFTEDIKGLLRVVLIMVRS